MSIPVDPKQTPNPDEKPNEPWYEAEDIGCSCNADGQESEWEWLPNEDCYVCQGCGETQ